MGGHGGAAKTHQAMMEESDFGVPDVDSADNITWGDTGGNKDDAASSAAGASRVALLRQILLSIGGNGNSHLQLFPGDIWYTDPSQPDDTEDGKSPETAKKTYAGARAVASAGDKIIMNAGTYTENVAIDLAALEVEGVIGVVVVGTVTGSADSCKLSGVVVAPGAGNAVDWTGNRAKIWDVQTVAGAIGFNIDGYQNIVTDTKATGYSVSGYDVANYNVHIKDAIAQGAGGATIGYHFSAAAADDCTLENCKSAKNATSSFYFAAGAEGTTIDGQCSSGAGDGRWVDTDEAQIWNDNFHFADYIEKVNTLSIGGGGGTVAYTLFKVTGSVLLESIVGVVETALTGTNTDTFLDLWSTNGSVLLTEDTLGENLGALIVGSVIAKVDESDQQLAVGSASGPAAIEEVDAKGEAVRIVEDRTGAAHVATYVRFTHTCAAAGTGEIHWYAQWRPVSEDGWLEVA